MEVTLALGIAAFCLVAIFGLLPVGLNSNLNAVEQAAAANAAGSVLADLRAAGTGAASMQFGIPLPANSTTTASTYSLFLREDGSWAAAANTTRAAVPGADADPAQQPRYRVTITFHPPPANLPRNATGVRVLVTWPAVADPTAGNPPTHFSGSFDTVAALDRN